MFSEASLLSAARIAVYFLIETLAIIISSALLQSH
jgi:hypothetical protein